MNIGSAQALAKSNNSEVSVAQLDSTHIALCWADNNRGSLYAVVGTISGASVSYGSIATISSVDVQSGRCSIVAMSSTKIVVSFQGSGGCLCYVGTISGTTISFGSPNQATSSSGIGFEASSAYLTSSTFALCYWNGSGLVLVVGTVSGTSISFGSPTGTLYGNITQIVCSLNGGATIITGGCYNAVYLQAATVSGTTISLGGSMTVGSYNSGSGYFIAGSAVSSSEFLIGFLDSSSGSKENVVDITISGTTMTVHGSTSTATTGISSMIQIAVLSASSFILGFGNSITFYAAACTLSSNTPSIGTPSSISVTASGSSFLKSTPLGSSSATFTFGDDTSGGYVNSVIVSLNALFNFTASVNTSNSASRFATAARSVAYIRKLTATVSNAASRFATMVKGKVYIRAISAIVSNSASRFATIKRFVTYIRKPSASVSNSVARLAVAVRVKRVMRAITATVSNSASRFATVKRFVNMKRSASASTSNYANRFATILVMVNGHFLSLFQKIAPPSLNLWNKISAPVSNLWNKINGPRQ